MADGFQHDVLTRIINVHWKEEHTTGGGIEVPTGCTHLPYAWFIRYEVVLRQHDPFTGVPTWTPGDPGFRVWAESFDWWEYMQCEDVPDVDWGGRTPPDDLCAAHAFIYIDVGILQCRVSDAGCAGIYPDVTTHPECFVGTTGNATTPPSQGVGMKL
jgi:hypothetical protein